MKSIRYIALLRGINVGGNNIIKMADLKACFESMKFANVVTYIQSGNVLFDSLEEDKETLVGLIEKTLSTQFNYSSKIVLITADHLRETVSDAPSGFGQNFEEYKYDVLFLKEPLVAKEALGSLKLRDGVDNAYAGNGVLYFSRRIKDLTKSYLSKVILLPIYKNMTIRNWNTTTKLLSLANPQ
ncbi:MAG: DUF1697 domain-containing protein [Candidatus Dojkabacteria bacterium]|nr:MAG: DUF1697 domain-containing protein [Candidatus Dojkabacteria bacterium]